MLTDLVLICPVCKEKISAGENTRAFSCCNNHTFDIAKEGYVNLLLGNKSGDKTGDSKESAISRHAFLEKGYYSCLKKAIGERLSGTVLDICCGEGYYDEYNGTFYGFDISREMVKMASKRYKNESPDHHYFVANLSSIPVKSKSIDTAMHLFAPFNEAEFSRILKDDGVLYSVIPGKMHLYEMKEIVYDTPYMNDEEAPIENGEFLHLASKTKVSETVDINGDDLYELFSMTPYFYRTSEENKSRLLGVKGLKLTVDFVILEYKKNL